MGGADRTVEIVVPFAAPPVALHACSEVRSALVTSSLAAIRARGLGERYFTELRRTSHERIRGLTANEWIPIEIALAHYQAIQSIVPNEQDQIAIGREVGVRLHRTLIGTLARLATSAGFTPWIGFAQSGKLWDRAFRGGGVSIQKLGPKEAKIEVVKQPLVDIGYFRVALRGAFLANCELLSKRTAIVREVRNGPQSVTFRASWV